MQTRILAPTGPGKRPAVFTDFSYSTEMFIDTPKLQSVPNFRTALMQYTKMLYFTRSTLGGFMNLGNCTVNKDVFIKIGGFESAWTKSMDTLLTIKLLKNGFSGSYCDAEVWFSPRRILANIDKWCADKSIRDYISIIRSSEIDIQDITNDQIQKTIDIKAERLLKRLMFLCLYETRPIIKSRVLEFTKNILPSISECSSLIYQSSLKINTSKEFLLKLTL